MDPFFKALGQNVLKQWKRANFSLDAFPKIACAALVENPPSGNVDLGDYIRDFLLDDEQAFQTHSGFGEPELVAYDHPRFYIQLLFWLDGTTDIHQHEFSGAFHVMAGSSLHSHFAFENARNVTPHLRTGNLRMQKVEILETGSTCPITSGRENIHSLFHLETPSVTVVIRTQNDPGTGPQFTYLPPHIALDPVFNDSLTMRRKQLLDMLEQTGDPSYAPLVNTMLKDLDFERGFYILQNCMGCLNDLGEWDSAMKIFRARHGRLASGVEATVEECARRDVIKDLRASVVDPDHRFFLALLMNVPSRKDLFSLVAGRYPEEKPSETILRWIEELAEPTEGGISVLDAFFAGEGTSPEFFEEVLSTFRDLLDRRATSTSQTRSKKSNRLRSIVTASTMRVLVATA